MKEKALGAVGAIVIIALLAWVARDRFLFATATKARIETLEAAGVCIVATILVFMIVLSMFVSLITVWRWFRGKSV